MECPFQLKPCVSRCTISAIMSLMMGLSTIRGSCNLSCTDKTIYKIKHYSWKYILLMLCCLMLRTHLRDKNSTFRKWINNGLNSKTVNCRLMRNAPGRFFTYKYVFWMGIDVTHLYLSHAIACSPCSRPQIKTFLMSCAYPNWRIRIDETMHDKW